MTLLYCFWVYTQWMLYSSTEILTHLCSLLYCSQQQEKKQPRRLTVGNENMAYLHKGMLCSY